MDEAYRMYRSETGGENSQTYPALARVPGGLFGICVAGTSGSIYRAGDTGHKFTIMSVAKPFVFALVCEVLGDEDAFAGVFPEAVSTATPSAPTGTRSSSTCAVVSFFCHSSTAPSAVATTRSCSTAGGATPEAAKASPEAPADRPCAFSISTRYASSVGGSTVSAGGKASAARVAPG